MIDSRITEIHTADEVEKLSVRADERTKQQVSAIVNAKQGFYRVVKPSERDGIEMWKAESSLSNSIDSFFNSLQHDK